MIHWVSISNQTFGTWDGTIGPYRRRPTFEAAFHTLDSYHAPLIVSAGTDGALGLLEPSHVGTSGMSDCGQSGSARNFGGTVGVASPLLATVRLADNLTNHTAGDWQLMRDTATRNERREARRGALRRGFTLVELLVAISIFVVVAALTIGGLNLSVTGERVREAARQVQSVIEGGPRPGHPPQPTGRRPSAGRREQPDDRHQLHLHRGPRTGYAPIRRTPRSVRSERQRRTAVEQYACSRHGPRDARAANPVFGIGTNWATLYERGLIGPGSSKIRLDPATVDGSQSYYANCIPSSFPIRTVADPTLAASVNGMPG